MLISFSVKKHTITRTFGYLRFACEAAYHPAQGRPSSRAI